MPTTFLGKLPGFCNHQHSGFLLQIRLHLNSFMQWSLRASLQELWSCHTLLALCPSVTLAQSSTVSYFGNLHGYTTSTTWTELPGSAAKLSHLEPQLHGASVCWSWEKSSLDSCVEQETPSASFSVQVPFKWICVFTRGTLLCVESCLQGTLLSEHSFSLMVLNSSTIVVASYADYFRTFTMPLPPPTCSLCPAHFLCLCLSVSLSKCG